LFVLYGRYILKAKNPDMDRVVLKEFLVWCIKYVWDQEQTRTSSEVLMMEASSPSVK
jgi:hypothetical protein